MARVRGTYLGVIAVCVFAMMPFVFSGCGGGAEYTAGGDAGPLAEPAVDAPDEVVADQNLPPINNPEEIEKLGNLDKTEELILSKAYDGALIVHLAESASKSAFQGQNFIAKEKFQTRDLSSIEPVVASYSNAKLRPFLDTDPLQLDKRRMELERLSGKKMPDWNLVFVVDIAEPASAVRLFRELRALHEVKIVYPRQKPILLDLAGTPDLTGLQGYLYPEDTHGGLNAMAAWREGIAGDGVAVLDAESAWNTGHEDLPVGGDFLIGGVDCLLPGSSNACRNLINHGTGVAGIIGGVNNGHGITGVSYGSAVYGFNYDVDGLVFLTDGIGDDIRHEIPPGSVIAMELGVRGALSDPLSGSQYGGLPGEASPVEFAATQQAIAAGITIIEAAGNGSVSLDDPAVYLPAQVNISLPENDSGSIIVGGSYGTGHDHRRPPELNCGDRVDVFAWGSGVVTTGYPYTGNPFTWTTVPGGPNPPNDDPNRYFINNFGGTSSATAMVAGAAALVQSYAKRELGASTRYLMPLKMREILVESGIPQTVTDGCNIGMQPRVDEAMRLVDGFLATTRASYPELDTWESLTEERMIALRVLGIGIICKEFDPLASDPLCPDAEVFPVGGRLAKDLDFDGDGRADLVQWTNPSAGSGRGGTWKLDLSSRGDGTSEDNFGAWDIEITYPPIVGQWVWPYVIDMNRDGRTDFVVYDKEHGKWYIMFTDSALTNNCTWHGWDWIIDYSAEWTDTLTLDPFGTDPSIPDSRYSRPVLADYNIDGWIDIAIACSDGIWRIDYGGPNRSDFGRIDDTVRYLSSAQLAQAPGWAYLAFSPHIQGGWDMDEYFWGYVGYKVPDGLPEAGRMVVQIPDESMFDLMSRAAHIYGGNECIPTFGDFSSEMGGEPGIKEPNGNWRLTSPDLSFGFIDFPPVDVFGGIDCQPVVADFDDDNHDDRTVMCPNEWRIAYSSSDRFLDQRDADGVRRIPLTYDVEDFVLPGQSYTGGVSYEYTRSMIELFMAMNPGVPPPIPVDMISVH